MERHLALHQTVHAFIAPPQCLAAPMTLYSVKDQLLATHVGIIKLSVKNRSSFHLRSLFCSQDASDSVVSQQFKDILTLECLRHWWFRKVKEYYMKELRQRTIYTIYKKFLPPAIHAICLDLLFYRLGHPPLSFSRNHCRSHLNFHSLNAAQKSWIPSALAAFKDALQESPYL